MQLIERLRNPAIKETITAEWLDYIQDLRPEDIARGQRFRFATIVTANNATCAAINRAQTIQFGIDHKRPVVAFRYNLQSKIRARFDAKGYNRDYLYNSFQDESWFYFVEGASGRFLYNAGVHYGIANRSSCTYHSITVQPDEEDDFNARKWRRDCRSLTTTFKCECNSCESSFRSRSIFRRCESP